MDPNHPNRTPPDDDDDNDETRGSTKRWNRDDGDGDNDYDHHRRGDLDGGGGGAQERAGVGPAHAPLRTKRSRLAVEGRGRTGDGFESDDAGGGGSPAVAVGPAALVGPAAAATAPPPWQAALPGSGAGGSAGAPPPEDSSSAMVPRHPPPCGPSTGGTEWVQPVYPPSNSVLLGAAMAQREIMSQLALSQQHQQQQAAAAAATAYYYPQQVQHPAVQGGMPFFSGAGHAALPMSPFPFSIPALAATAAGGPYPQPAFSSLPFLLPPQGPPVGAGIVDAGDGAPFYPHPAAVPAPTVGPYLSSLWAAGVGPPHPHQGFPPTGAYLQQNAGLQVPGGFAQNFGPAAASAGRSYPFPAQGLDLQPASLAAAAAAAADGASGPSNAYDSGGRPRVFPMSHPSDEEIVSKYQCLLRKQIEFFEAANVDLKARAQGRNVPIKLGQIGIRCKWCSDAGIPPGFRPRGSVYFPVKLASLYQSAQNMANNHWSSGACSSIPESVLSKLNLFKHSKCSGLGSGGHGHWIRTAQSIGIADSQETGLFYQGPTNDL